MVINSSQSGYALVLLLGWSSVVGAGFMMGYGYSQQNQGGWQALWQDAKQLNDERERLLFYSVDYVNLYGHGGAGPGHLPCPDTDEGAARPGPNPPCGNTDSATGKLPDGVSRNAGRIAFADSFYQRSTYTVITSVINNPAQALSVNLWPEETEFTVQTSAQTSASASASASFQTSTSASTSAKGYALLQRPSGQARVLSRSALELSAWRWVRAWYVTQWLTTKFDSCQKRSRQQPIALCTISASNIPITLPAEHCIAESPVCQLHGTDLLNWWLGPSTQDWHGVPVNQHWFVKNGWVDVAGFEWHRECVAQNTVCGLYISDDQRTVHISLLPLTTAFIHKADGQR